MLRVKGEDTCSPLVGVVMTVCATPGTITVASSRQTKERFRFSFIENTFTEKFVLPEVACTRSSRPADRRRERVALTLQNRVHRRRSLKLSERRRLLGILGGLF
jgi:hypothetical protein